MILEANVTTIFILIYDTNEKWDWLFNPNPQQRMKTLAQWCQLQHTKV